PAGPGVHELEAVERIPGDASCRDLADDRPRATAVFGREDDVAAGRIRKGLLTGGLRPARDPSGRPTVEEIDEGDVSDRAVDRVRQIERRVAVWAKHHAALR